jgi:hypothetical protein
LDIIPIIKKIANAIEKLLLLAEDNKGKPLHKFLQVRYEGTKYGFLYGYLIKQVAISF